MSNSPRRHLACIGCALALASLAQAQWAPPETMAQIYTYAGGSLTVNYTKLSVRGPHFAVWLQNADGTFTPQARAEPVSTYVGRVVERPGAVAACMTFADGSMKTSLTLEDGARWTGTGTSLSLPGTSWTPKYPTELVGAGGAGSTVYAADIGLDLCPSYFEQQSESVTKTVDMAEFTLIDMNSMMLRDTAMQLRLARVIIRGGSDPYAENHLANLKSQWEGPLESQLPATSYDFVAGVRPNLGGGVAYSPGQFSFNRSLNQAGNGNFAQPWRHELGHNLSSPHYPGGGPEGPTPMSGNQLMRYSSPEVARIVSRRNSIQGNLANLGAAAVPVPPRANGDRGTVSVNRTPLTLDVLANDSDSNGHALTIHSFWGSSEKGGAITRSVGTGPGGRDRLIYTPSASLSSSLDWFEYRIQDSSGQQSVGLVVFQVENSSVPDPWTSADIGAVGDAGNATHANGAFTVRGAGADIWGTADGFHFLHQPLSGNGEITARVASVQNTHTWAKAGVMIRDSLDANSARVVVVVTPGQGVTCNARATAGQAADSSTTTSGAAPRWVRLRRLGNVFTAYASTDGVAWTQFATRTVAMGEEIFMGLAVTSHDTSATCSAVFDNVSANSFGAAAFCISEHPQSQDAYAGASVTFSSAVVAAVAVTFQWQKDGVDIQGATAATLTLSAVQTSDSGDYVVLVTGDGITVASESASLTTRPLGTGHPRAVRLLDPLAYWRLNEAAGPAAFDELGTFDGAFTGGVTANQAGPRPAAFPFFEAVNAAYSFAGTGSRLAIPALELNSNTVTFTAWVKRNGNAPSWAGIAFSRAGSTVAGLDFGSANELRYHWNNSSSSYNWNSGLMPPNGVWTFVALVIEPDKATIYMHAGSGLVSATNAVAHAAEEFDGEFCIGQDTLSDARSFNGAIDEVAVFNRALSAAEIASLATPPAAVSIAATTPQAGEMSAPPGRFTITRTDAATSTALGVNLSVTGSATPGSDYTSLGGTVTIPAGAASLVVNVTPIADALAEGAESVSAALAAGSGYYVSSPSSATVTIHDLPIDQWRLSRFGANANNAQIAGDFANPDRDAWNNILEYALNGEPFAEDASLSPHAELAGGFLSLTYRKNLAATDLTFTVLESASLAAWAPAIVTEQILSDDGATRVIRASVPTAGAPGKFLRLQVTHP